ncbi:hypothetical protein Ahy_A09g043060 [Arachis hypogaea]|uniref:PB1-like domain-containing protein n=1 Tax=Arachis hypogaea TaxID=3818 RepID=A0A445BHF0_ARAHY|nr:hypothetical protein Ahy_A09g043060 [Arachis hypogaea]
MALFNMRVHHGGLFGYENGVLKYLKSQCTVVEDIDGDRWSVFEAYEELRQLGYMKSNISALWYKDPTEDDFERHSKLLVGVTEAIEMSTIAGRRGFVDLFVVHEVEDAEGFSEGREAVSDDVSSGEDSDDPTYLPSNEEENSVEDIHFTDSDEVYHYESGFSEDNAVPKDCNVEKGKKVVTSDLDDEDAVDSDELEQDHVIGGAEMGADDGEYDAEEGGQRFPVHKTQKDMGKYQWKVGTLYESRQEFKDTVAAYVVNTARDIKFKKCDLVRVRAVCQKGCPFWLYAHRVGEESTWQLRSMNLQHSCMQTHRVGIMHSKWLGRQFKKKVESNPKIKVKELVAKAHKKWNLTVTKTMAANSKQEALSQIQGAFREQYKQINDYCHELLRTNPGSTVILKGLLPAFEEVIPGVDNRFCVRHLYSNFRKKFPGLELKNKMWRCAKASHWQSWEKEMKNLRVLNEGAFRHLNSIPPRFWSRSRFTFLSKCDSLVNNMSESFNAVLVEAREKPIVSMLEDIRVYMMTRWAANRERVLNYPGNIMPIIRKKLEKRASLARDWRPYWCYQEVIHPVNGPELWERTQYDDVIPPPYRRPSHRPVKKRKRGAADEDNRSHTHVSRRGEVQRCSNCGGVGHKKSGCKQPKKRAQTLTKRANKNAPKLAPGQTVLGGRNRNTTLSPPNFLASHTRKTPTRPKKREARPTTEAPKPKKASTKPKKASTQPNTVAQPNNNPASAATSTSNKQPPSQPCVRKRPFSVIQCSAPHLPLQKLRLMAKLPPSQWGNL